MNVYMDSSALVKLLIAEPESEQLIRQLSGATIFSCRITYAEARAAIARRSRELPERVQEWAEARAHLEVQWPGIVVIEVVQALVTCAGEFADVFSLRGFDAVQLAAAHVARESSDEDLVFLSFDRRLNRAARLLGLGLPEDPLL